MRLLTEIKAAFYRYRFALKCANKVFWIQAEDLRVQTVKKLNSTDTYITHEELFMDRWRKETSARLAKGLEQEIYNESKNKGAIYG